MDADVKVIGDTLFRDRLSAMRDERDRANKRVAELMQEIESAQLRLRAALDEVQYYKGKRHE